MAMCLLITMQYINVTDERTPHDCTGHAVHLHSVARQKLIHWTLFTNWI